MIFTDIRNRDTTGHLFEKRYYPILVDADEYLLQLLRYVHLNPVRARMVGHPSDYPWSSHRTYLGTATQSWITTDFVLNMFHPDRHRAIAAYARFVDENLSQPAAPPLTARNPNDPRILGSDDFARKLLEATWRPKSHKTLTDLIAEACQQFRVTPDALLSTRSQRHLTH